MAADRVPPQRVPPGEAVAFLGVCRLVLLEGESAELAQVAAQLVRPAGASKHGTVQRVQLVRRLRLMDGQRDGHGVT